MGSGVRAKPGLLVALYLAALAMNLVPWPAELARRLYLGGTHPALLAVTGPLTDSVTPSLTGLIATGLLVIPLVIALMLASWRWLGAYFAWGGLVLLLTFPFAFGLGYRLPPLVGDGGAAPSETEVAWAAERAVAVLWEGARFAPAAQVGASPGGGEQDGSLTEALLSPAAFRDASLCVGAAAAELRGGSVRALPRRVKRLPPGLMLRFGFAGVVSPWLLEPHVDAALPPAAALGVALHEFAHAAGFAREAEAEAVGIVAGLACRNRAVAYAAALNLATSLSAGAARSPRAAWPERAQADARAASLAAARYRSDLALGATRAYDAYLRSQGERSGVGEYGRGTLMAVRLLSQLGAPSAAPQGSGG